VTDPNPSDDDRFCALLGAAFAARLDQRCGGKLDKSTHDLALVAGWEVASWLQSLSLSEDDSENAWHSLMRWLETEALAAQ
jgi:hypothetical protein